MLFLRRSRKPPLLKVISDLFCFDILVWIRLTAQERVARGQWPRTLADSVSFEQVNSVNTWLVGGDEEWSVFDALDREEVRLGDTRHSYAGIIAVVADKMEAHIDGTVKDTDLALHSERVKIGGYTPAQLAIVDTARTTVELMNTILSHVRTGQQYPHIRARSSSPSE